MVVFEYAMIKGNFASYRINVTVQTTVHTSKVANHTLYSSINREYCIIRLKGSL